MRAKSGAPGVHPWLAVVHATLGLLLGVFAVLHGIQNYPAVKAADAWVERALDTAIGFGLGLVVLGVFALHAALGFARWLGRRAATARGESPRDWGSTFQLVTGLVVLAFITFHVVQLWPSGSGSHSSIREPYARMWQQLGQPLPLVAYVAGVTACAFHIGHGLARLLARARSVIPQFAARALGGALGFALFLLFVQIVARFALGEPLIPALS